MRRLTTEEVIEQFREIHGDKYCYDRVDYQGNGKHVEIICHKHGSFKQAPNDHKKGCGCPKCGFEQRALSRTLDTERVVADFKSVHGERYCYDKVIYQGDRKHVEIICHKHGSFKQSSSNHKQGYGCPECGKKSQGEAHLRKILECYQIKFEQQKKYDGSVGVRNGHLSYDFYLPDYNVLIEVDGMHHHKPFSYSKTKTEETWQEAVKRFETQQGHDNRKTTYAIENKILLLRLVAKNGVKLMNRFDHFAVELIRSIS